MATWRQLGEGFRRNISLTTGSGMVLAFGTEDLTVNSSGDHEDMEPGDIENDIGLPALGSTFSMAPTGTILREKRLIAGPASGRAIVACVYAPPTDFSGGTRPGIQVSVSNDLEFFYYKTQAIFGAGATYAIKRESFGRRAQLTITESKPYPILGSPNLVISLIASNHGKLYYKYNAKVLLVDSTFRIVTGQTANIVYRFQGSAPIKERPADPSRGFALALPALSWLGEYRMVYDNTTGQLVGFEEDPAEDKYEFGDPLP